MSRGGITLVEVGPRDGFQSIATVIPTSTKIDLIEGLHQAGLRRMEATAFVSESAVPQLADAAEILKAASALSDMSVQVLVPNLRHAERALEAGANRLAFVLSVSDRHNHNNVRRTPMESVAEYARIIDMIPDEVDVRLNVATAFDCPFDGPMPADRTLALLQELIPIKPDAEICPCDTTGRVTPDDGSGHAGSCFGVVASRTGKIPDQPKLGVPRARHLRTGNGQCTRCLGRGGFRYRRLIRRPGRMPLRAGCNGQRRHRGRRVDV